MIGDPTDKTEMRPMLSQEHIGVTISGTPAKSISMTLPTFWYPSVVGYRLSAIGG